MQKWEHLYVLRVNIAREIWLQPYDNVDIAWVEAHLGRKVEEKAGRLKVSKFRRGTYEAEAELVQYLGSQGWVGVGLVEDGTNRTSMFKRPLED